MIYLYEIDCNKGQIYVGITKYPEKRFKQHQSGKGAKFTKIYGAKTIKIISLFEEISNAKLAESEHVLYLRNQFPNKTIHDSGWTSTKINPSKIHTS